MSQKTIGEYLKRKTSTQVYYTTVYFSDLHRWQKRLEKDAAKIVELQVKVENQDLDLFEKNKLINHFEAENARMKEQLKQFVAIEEAGK